jgi:hypothetical protein
MIYRSGSSYVKPEKNDISILDNGTVRVKIDRAASGVTINRVAVYNSIGEQWAYQDCNIVVSGDQTGFLFWFDFTITDIEDGRKYVIRAYAVSVVGEGVSPDYPIGTTGDVPGNNDNPSPNLSRKK